MYETEKLRRERFESIIKNRLSPRSCEFANFRNFAKFDGHFLIICELSEYYMK